MSCLKMSENNNSINKEEIVLMNNQTKRISASLTALYHVVVEYELCFDMVWWVYTVLVCVFYKKILHIIISDMWEDTSISNGIF